MDSEKWGLSGPGHRPGRQSKPGASNAALLPGLQTLRIPLASSAPCTARQGCWLVKGSTTLPVFLLALPPQPQPVLSILLGKPTSTAGSSKNPQTWSPFFQKFVKLSIPKLPFPTRVPEASSCRSERAKGGRRGILKGAVLHTFSQVHSSSLGDTRRATPCPRASRLRWAQKSRSSASSSSPSARQYRSYRNRPPL